MKRMKKVNKYFTIICLLIISTSFAQSSRYTKGAENGYSWSAMSNPLRIYDNSKYNYLGEILERYRLLKQSFPEVEYLSCGEELNDLLKSGESDNISLEYMVEVIDEFYSDAENLSIPIVFAYCYSIKELSGASKDELIDYKKDVLDFCKN